MRYFYRIKGLGFVLWHSRHEFYHVLVGLVWAWILREAWNQFNLRWVILAVFGSLLPDADHFLYFFTYGKKESYTRTAFNLLKSRSWRNLTIFLETSHKYNTELSYHNIYFTSGLFILSLLSGLYEWRVGVILFGAMVLHYLFDIFDDLVILGYVNSNWKRWGRSKR